MYSWQDMGQGRWSDHAWTNKALHGGCIIDPYLVWADLTRFADLGRELKKTSWVPLLLRVNGPASRLANEVEGSELSKYLRIARMYQVAAQSSLEPATFCSAAVTQALFEELDRDTGLKGKIKQLQLGLPIREREDEPRVHEPLDASYGAERGGEPPVFVGVIDDGFAFAHARFRRPGTNETRIDGFWDQGEGWGNPNRRTASVPYGTELTYREINGFLQHPTGAAGLVDEDEIYRRCGYRGVDLRVSHGTHVMDLACGSDPGEAAGSDPGEGAANTRLPRILCVALPRQTTGDTSGLSLGVYVLDGLRYILDRADRLAPGAQIVVNLSYGAIAGPHDGSSMLETAIDQLVELRKGKLQVVIAAGNNHLSRCHAEFSLEPSGSRSLDWRILPDDATPSFLEIWLPPQPEGEQPTDVTVSLTPPGGESTGETVSVRPGEAREMLDGEEVVGTVINSVIGESRMILVTVAPTVTLHPTRRVARAGTWRVDIVNGSTHSLQVDAWIQRDDNVRGFRRRGRQSYFDDPEYVRLDHNGRPVEEDDAAAQVDRDEGAGGEHERAEPYVRRAGTLNSIGTGKRTILVGGYRASDGAPALYSASGPDDPGDRFRATPNAMAVSDRSITRHGVLATGARSGSTVAMNGTSVAAPQITRWIAERMLANEPADAEALRAQALEDDPDPKPVARAQSPAAPALPPDVSEKPPPARGGFGRIRMVEQGEDGPDTFRPFAKR